MKKTKKWMIIWLPALIITAHVIKAAPVAPQSSSLVTITADWTKSTTGTWPGMKDGMTYWYKIDKKGGLWWSADGKKWAAVKDGAWADKDSKWLKIHDMKLVWSADGKTWSEVPEWKWQGSDGKWYKFDKSWNLWVNG